MVAVICGVIGLVVNTISCLCVKELPEEDSVAVEDTQKPKDDKIGFVESLKLLISNKYYILIVAIYIVYYFMSNLTTGSAIYFMKHVLGNGSLLGLFSMMKMFPVIIALIFTPILVKKTGSMQKVNFWGYVISDILGIFLIIFGLDLYESSFQILVLTPNNHYFGNDAINHIGWCFLLLLLKIRNKLSQLNKYLLYLFVTELLYCIAFRNNVHQ
jgi:Na+/melibiose symporter-like transporter